MEQSKFYQIKNITEQEYTLVGCDGSVITRPIQDVDKSASAFTIQDAKDGDVLAVNNDVFIYAHRKQMYSIAVAHCFVDSTGVFHLDGEFGYTEKGNSTQPATKEQRDLLFQKMKEAGYEWDAEKKELKKIEQSPSWSEEDKRIINDIEESLIAYKIIIMDNDKELANYIERELVWIKFLKERTFPQSKQEWSKKDSPYYDDICEMLINLLHSETANVNKDAVQKDLDWFISLNDRYTWKPSDEQMKVLSKYAEQNNYDGSVLTSLYQELKKLK